jgi:hypothetical protein
MKIEDLYRDWVHPRAGVFTRAAAWEEIGPAVRQALVDAALQSPEDSDVDAAAYALFMRADKHLTDLGDKDIRRAVETGAVPLDEERLEALVALGQGDRVKFGDMGIEEYRRADERHYANLRAIQNSYDDWRRAWSVYLPYLDRGLRVRDVRFDGDGDV